jgi:hypothetical protein
VNKIGIVGSGIAGLHLGLYLQKHGINSTIYSDRSAEQIRSGRLQSLVVRFEPTLERERALGVHHWDYSDFGVFGVHMHVGVEPPIVWRGSLKRPASSVDMRIYQSTLLEDFESRGGTVVVASLQASDVARLSADHELMVVASGRGSLTEMFPRDSARSPFSQPQRRLIGGFCRGIELPDCVVYTISPGNGEIFQTPFTTFDARVCSLLFEGIPGQAFEPLMQQRYEDNPSKFEATMLELIEKHAPPIYERIKPSEFGVLRPLDILQGAVTPTVRRGLASLENGKFAMALGDIHMVNDPIIAQGANLASRCAWLMGEALVEDTRYDESFCSSLEDKLWQTGKSATEWTNATLLPPPQHVMEVFVAASHSKALADELIENFGAPDNNWQIFSSPEGAAAFLSKHQG